MEGKRIILFNNIKLEFLKVTFFSAIVLLLETVLFHILIYIYDYYVAMMVISFTIIGIGLGAFAASRTKISENIVFVMSCLGTTICIYVTTTAVLLFYPFFWIAASFITLCFFFPAFYVATAFRNHRSNYIYMYDMIGAGLGIVLVVFLYKILFSEEIILLLLLIIPLVGFLYLSFKDFIMKKLSFVFIILVIMSGGLLYQQLACNSLNIFQILRACKRDPSIFALQNKAFNSFLRHESQKPVSIEHYKYMKSYDHLMGRIDILHSKKYPTVFMNGFGADHFTNQKTKMYEDYYKSRGIKWPTRDRRFIYGVVDEPKVFILGSSAQGITKSIKKITPLDNIVTVEIHPSIVKIMTKDFYQESGQAYKGLNPIIGNGISVLKSIKKRFDIITLINTHSTRTISYQGPPDYLHTVESYNLYLDHLSEKGYLNFEERVIGEEGQLALYRMINTLWHSLKYRGETEPELHFVLWDWTKYKRYHYRYYMGMIVTKNPIDRETKYKIVQWMKHLNKNKKRINILYFKGIKEDKEYAQLFHMIKTGDFSALKDRDFDVSIATNNRPFVQVATKSNLRLSKILIYTGLATLILWVFLIFNITKGNNKKEIFLLTAYNIFIGFAYFFIEIIIFQIYQNIFIAVSSTFILVLTVLLLSSGIGGCFYEHFSIKGTVFLLAIALFSAALYAPHLIFTKGIPLFLIKFISVFYIGITGLLIGTYFPRGLDITKKRGFGDRVPYFFAINSLAGSFAIVPALFLGIKIGYQATILIALLLYIGATLILEVFNHSADTNR